MSNVIKPEDNNENEDNLMIDEFDIIELEDRLEMIVCCNGRCDNH